MDSSLIAIDRTVQLGIETGEISLKEVRRNGKVLVSDFRNLSDGEIISKLDSIGAEVFKDKMENEIKDFYSAEEYSNWFRQEHKIRNQDVGENTLWMGLTVLWERWFPREANFEKLDEKIYQGYLLREKKELEKSFKIWSSAWEDIKALMAKFDFKDVRDLNSVFRGTVAIENWASDFELYGYNVGLIEKSFFQRRIDFCIEYLNRSKTMHKLNKENMQKAIAESLFCLGNKAEGESMFVKYLKDDPQWGWGWIAWADCYWLIEEAGCSKDLKKAEEILLKALEIEELRDKLDVKDRLASLYHDMGDSEAAGRIQDEILLDVLRDNGDSKIEYTSENTMSKKIEINRNDPCPCGSGLKYKKCCGK